MQIPRRRRAPFATCKKSTEASQPRGSKFLSPMSFKSAMTVKVSSPGGMLTALQTTSPCRAFFHQERMVKEFHVHDFAI